MMAVEPARSTRLASFAAGHAEPISTWIRDEQEAYWLAPRSRLPLTPRRVLSWGENEGDRFVLVEKDGHPPLAYGEINRLARDPGTYWLGHLVVDPEQRGRGHGVVLTRLLLEYGFQRGARRITLVVFPDNHTAIAAYARAGLEIDGHETHHFPIYRRSVRLVRMATTAEQWLRRG